jgi:acyl-coenzyme A thioesterase PaaI-like protein
MNQAAAELIAALGALPKPDCAALTPFTILDAGPEPGFVRVAFAPQPAFRNHFGNIQGGFASAMLDVVLSVAAFARYRQWLPTVEIKTNFLDPIPVGPCLGEGRVVKAGRTLAFLEALLAVPGARPAVTASATAMVPPPKASA